jgi:flagellar hook protein FlgE
MGLSFSTALSGLSASSNALGVTGNNIANANTTAYKSSTISFADVFLADGGSPVEIGGGVRSQRTNTNFNQGGLTDSANSTNAAIQGNGFFVVKDQGGAQAYTRAGEFTLDRNGYLVTPSGQQVQGFAAVNGVVSSSTPLSSVKAPVGETIQPTATTQATIRMNLNSDDAAGSVFSAPVQVFDSKGVSRTLNMTFTRQVNGSYLMNATLDGVAANLSANGGAAAATATITFDSNGLLATPASLSVLPDQTQLDGATLPSVALGLRQTNPDGTPGAPNITNFALRSSVAATEQDGYPAGSPVSFTIDSNGMLLGNFSNGKTRAVAQLAIATFNAQTEMRHIGDNMFRETLDSGQATIGTAGTSGRGQVVGNALEQSNVDLATEFTSLIVAQRSFQANSRVISTISQTLEELLQTR